MLATNTNLEIPGHRSTRRPATPKEIAIVSRLAKQWLTEYELDQRLLKQGIMDTVTSTELRKGGWRAVIGRFDVKSKRSLHSLFAVAEQDGTRYQLTLASLVVQSDRDSEKDKQEIKYIDQLDINNDGIDELIRHGIALRKLGLLLSGNSMPSKKSGEQHITGVPNRSPNVAAPKTLKEGRSTERIAIAAIAA